VIRQAISCDICGNEKKQTNHWFVAYEQAGELRVSGWSSRNRLRPGTKHLCGQTCLHKLMDEYMAKAIGLKAQAVAQSEVEAVAPLTDSSLTSQAGLEGFESSARLITPMMLPTATMAALPVSQLAATASNRRSKPAISLPEEPRFSSRNWRAEAWERERERELRSQDRRNDLPRRRASGH
jgi:hypothetical protein